jgi:DNA-binding transcriptional ArsR family regulator
VITAAALLAAIEKDAALVQLADAGNDAAVAEALNTPDSAQCDAPSPLTIDGLFALLSEASIARLSVHPSVTYIRDDVMTQQRERVSHWAKMLAARPDPNGTGTITTAERDEVLAALAATSKQSCTIAEALGKFGDVVSVSEISDALYPRRVQQVIDAHLDLRWPAVNVYVSPEDAAARGLTAAHVLAAKARHEGTILGVDVAARADAIALVRGVDSQLADTLTTEAADDDARRVAEAKALAAAET